VKAYIPCGYSDFSDWDAGSCGAVSAPTGVSAADGVSCDSVKISWDAMPGAASYEVFRATSSGGSYTSIGTTGSTSYNDSTAALATTYYYKVQATGACGSSELSDWDEGSLISGLPAAPASISATDGTHCDKVAISWSSVAGAISYEVMRATSSGGTYTPVGTSGFTAFDDTTAVSGTTYYYKVSASNSCGSSALSDWSDGFRNAAPEAPTGVSATDGTYCDKVTVSWGSVAGAAEYDVRRATSSGGSYSSLGPTTSTSYDDTTAASGTTYYYKILASNGCGSSALSVWDDGSRNGSPTPPSGTDASDGTSCDEVTVTWSSVSGATSYEIYRATSSGGSYALLGSVGSGTTLWSDDTGTAGITYYYRIMACNSCGCAYSPTQWDDGYRGIQASTPTGVTATDDAHCDKVSVTWDSVSGATSYDVQRATSSGGTYSSIGTTGGTTMDDNTATPGATYYYKVSASNACGSSALSDWDAGSRTTAPSSPTGLAASDGSSCDHVTIDWGSVAGATEYAVYRATSSGGTYSSIGSTASTSYNDSSASAGTTYYYKVSATATCGSSGLSDWDDGYRNSVPSTPTGISATDGTHCDYVTVSWDSVPGSTLYGIRRATSSGGTYSTIDTSATTSFNDTSASPGTTYYYKVFASNSCGPSGISDWDDGYRADAPTTPTNVSASWGTHCDKVTMSWDSVAGATSYDVRRATSSGGSYGSIGTTASTSYNDVSAVSSTIYYYKVAATNSCGSSALSDYGAGYRESVPPSPSSVSATDGTHCDKVTVSWFIPSNATGCEIYRATSSGGSYSSIGTTGIADHFDDTTATPGTTYYYKVSASNSCGEGSLSSYNGGYRSTTPSAPSGVSATDGTYCDKVTVSWSSVTGATAYDVRRATSSGGSYSSLATTASTSYDDTTAVEGATYYYKVLASNSCGDSPL
ncbi:hypothetical protein ACFLSG_05130, partial [Candidatus Bipolaricaulota bacterium]